MPCVLPLLLGRLCTLGLESRRGSPGFVPPSGGLLSREVGDTSSDPHQERSCRPPRAGRRLVFAPGLGTSFVFSETGEPARGASASGRRWEAAARLRGQTWVGGQAGPPAGPHASLPPVRSARPALGHPAPERLSNLPKVTQRNCRAVVSAPAPVVAQGPRPVPRESWGGGRDSPSRPASLYRPTAGTGTIASEVASLVAPAVLVGARCPAQAPSALESPGWRGLGSPGACQAEPAQAAGGVGGRQSWPPRVTGAPCPPSTVPGPGL